MNIKVEDLFYLYARDDQTTVALRGLNLEVASGKCLVINGPNGSGKSTLVRILTGFAQSSAGKVLFADLDISKIDPVTLRRNYVSSIDQKGNLLTDLTVRENIALACSLMNDHTDSVEFRTLFLIDQYKLQTVANAYPDALAASERQMVALAVALATNPKILIADEPSGELDDRAARVLYQALKELSGKVTVILVTHDPRAEVISDQVVRIRNGRISQSWRYGETEINVVDQFGWSHSDKNLAKTASKPRRKLPPVRSKREPALYVKNLGLAIGKRIIFTELTFTASPGELIAVSGSAGSGKSSLLRILSGIQPPTNGEVKYDGFDIHQFNRADSAIWRGRTIGYLAQGADPLERISLSDHLLSTGKDPLTLLGEVGAHADRSLNEFSGGERARIEILKLLSLKRPLLLLDEPTSQLDEMRTNEITNLIRDYLAQGGIVIASTREPLLLQLSKSILDL